MVLFLYQSRSRSLSALFVFIFLVNEENPTCEEDFKGDFSLLFKASESTKVFFSASSFSNGRPPKRQSDKEDQRIRIAIATGSRFSDGNDDDNDDHHRHHHHHHQHRRSRCNVSVCVEKFASCEN